MQNIIESPAGLIHLIASTFALIFGAMVLVMHKGTKNHVKIGYAYFVSMLLLIATAFMIYRLFDGWGIFHYLTVTSLITLLIGMVPIWLKPKNINWKYLHFCFMYWSVIGLYAAFAAELLTRIPQTPFMGMVGVATGVIMLFGTIIFGKNKKKWSLAFGK